ncbi:MAG: BlaI/MecI/CopY family transcriptional regulator [Lachnospiraceae bacterium]|nr:BlaI/MecI/CopY family transcriptional regulator [Lachnospiraceae bacterium]MCI9283545.1 BlaI/MecI/CopY family transcriptional regulator [Lachnospiraceae bacterium]
MAERKLFDGEYRFMELVWEYEPVRSMELARLCLENLGWKKSTCFTVLKKLIERGFVKNEQAVVTAVVKRAEVQKTESKEAVDRNFGGSLPAFVAAFLSDRRLTEEEAKEIRAMIEKAVE